MKNIFFTIIITGLIYLIDLTGFSTSLLNNSYSYSHESINNILNIRVRSLYSKGSIPIKIGMPDTLIVNITKDPGPYIFRLRIYILEDYTQNIFDTAYVFNPGNFVDTTIRHQMPRYYSPKTDKIIVEALPGSKLDHASLVDTVYDSKQYCQNITYDTYNYADPCIIDTGGFGFTGRVGNIVAGFRNNDSLPVIISSVEQSFFDSSGGGGKPYSIVIYGDNIDSKPGPLLYRSPDLITPPGTGSPNKLSPYQINSFVIIPPHSRFYIGYRQISTSSIKASYQNETPVRDRSFFFSSPDTVNNWFDFKDSAKNIRMDIAPILSISVLKMNFIMQGFYNSVTNKLNKTDTLRVYLRQSIIPYPVIDSAVGKIDSVNFERSFAFNYAPTASYYIEVKHRNCIETWSKFPVFFIKGGLNSFSFIPSSSQAYGNNMVQVSSLPVRFAGYSGEINKDGIIDLTDVILTFNDAVQFLSGYFVTDLNGDNITDLSDLVLCYNNASSFVARIRP